MPERVVDGIKVGGQVPSDVRFADDQVILATSEDRLYRNMNGRNEVTNTYGMKINIKKTKVMKLSRHGGATPNITINGKKVEQVRKFRCLGALITDDGRCEVDIRARIAMAEKASGKKTDLEIEEN